MENQNFTFGKSLSALITLELVNLKTKQYSDEITSVLIVDLLQKKHPEIETKLNNSKEYRDYFKRRVRSTLNELANSKLLKIEAKKTKINTIYNTYFILF
jgi:hypothetical protein